MERGHSLASFALVGSLAACSETGDVSIPRLGHGPNGRGGTLCVILDRGQVACTGSAAVPPQWVSEEKHLRVVPGLPPIADVTITAYPHAACGIADDATAWCWGDDSVGATGRGHAAGELAAPEEAYVRPGPVPALPRVTSIVGGLRSFCALVEGGSVWCWGGGELVAPISDRPVLSPVRIEGLPDAIEIAASLRHACARSEQGAVWCWGRIGGSAVSRPVERVGAGASGFVADSRLEVCFESDAGRQCVDPQLEDPS